MVEEDGGAPILYPAYIEEQFRERNLAYYADNSITTEQGIVYTIPDFSTLLTTIFEHNLLTFMLQLPTFPYIEQVIQYGGKVLCSEDGKPLGIRIKGGKNTARWIVSASGWGCDRLSVEWLQLLRQVYQTAQVGTPATPGALGQAMFRQSFKQSHGDNWRQHRHRRPSGPIANKIREESSGARSEVFQLGVVFDVAYENDQHNGYGAALAAPQPTGKTFSITGKVAQNYPFYFVKCEVMIHHDMVIGPFPVRVGDKRNRHPVFPCDRGVYVTWLWNREIETTRREGCSVKIISGFAWREATYDFAPFVEAVAQLRDTAPHEVRPFLKLALVAAVGRLGMPSERYSLVAGRDRIVGDTPVCDAGIAYDWWIHQEHDSYPQSMPHMFSHTLMLCRLSLFEMAKRCMQQELNVIATNTDAVITEKRDATLQVKGEHVETGEWTALELHNVIVKANRHLDSDEKSVHPGVPKKR